MVYIVCIGSNEHPKENLAFARKRLMELFLDIRFSDEEETRPYNMTREVLFTNQVAYFKSDKQVADIISCLKSIEQEAGRTAEEKEQEIVRLDIDLLAGDATIYKPEDWNRAHVRRGVEMLKTNIIT